MADRHYDDDEAREIFDEASRSPGTPEGRSAAMTSGSGFTLAELQEIGAEAGIDPLRIAQAARSLQYRPEIVPGPVRRMAGLPVGVSRTVDLGPSFDDADWNRLVVDLRDTFDARGTIHVQGGFREWTNGNLQALVEPTGDGFQLRLRTRKETAWATLGLSLVGLVFSVFLTLVLLNKGELDVKWVVPAFFALMSVGGVVSQMVQLPAWARTREQQMEAVARRALLGVAEEEQDDHVADHPATEPRGDQEPSLPRTGPSGASPRVAG